MDARVPHRVYGSREKMNKADTVKRIMEVTWNEALSDRKYAEEIVTTCVESYAVLMLRSYRNKIDIGTQEALSEIAKEIEKR